MSYHKFSSSSKVSSQSSENENGDESPQVAQVGRSYGEASEGTSEAHSSSNPYFCLDRVGEQVSGTDKGAESSKTDDEGQNRASGAEGDKAPERIVKLNQSISRPGIEGLELDDYIRLENIVAPPKYRKRHFVREEQSLTSRMLNRMGNEGTGISSDADEESINMRQPVASTSGLQQKNMERQTHHVQKAAETVVRDAVSQNGLPLVPVPSMPYIPYHFFTTNDDIPEWTQDCWGFLSVLENKGIPLFWEVLRRDYLPNDPSRLFRCVVSFNHVEGVCEASTSLQAKHGAAWNFLQEFQSSIPIRDLRRLGPFPDIFDNAILTQESAYSMLVVKTKEMFGQNIFQSIHSFKLDVRGRTLFQCIVQVAWAKFVGSSYINARVAELFAVKVAYEKLVGQPCPRDPIYIGNVNCTPRGNSFYRILESQRLHYRVDFPHADPDQLRNNQE